MNKHTFNIVTAAMLGAVAFVIMFIEISIPQIIPGFVKLDFSDIPELLGAYAMGPVYGVVVAFIKNVLHAIIKGSSTGYVGELANFLMGATFAFVAGLIYTIKKTKTGAIVGAVIGSIAMGIISFPINLWITYPMYGTLINGGIDSIVAMYQAILSWADELWICLLVFNVPFTIVKGLICTIICRFIYKPLSPIIHWGR